MTERVLWVTGEVPDKSLGGGSIRQAHLLVAVAAAVETHLVVAGKVEDPDVRAAAASVTEVSADVLRRPPSKVRRRAEDVARALFDGRSPEVIESAGVVSALSPRLQEMLRPGDLVQVEHTGLAPLVSLREAQPSARWAITLHTVESERIRHRYEVAPSSRHRWALGRERNKAVAIEREVVGRYDAVWVTSDDDAAALPHQAAVVPNGVDTSAFLPSPLPAGHDLVFTGTLDYLPNIDGLRWFCTEVLPLIKKRVPDATLTVVGRKPVPEVLELAGDSVRVVANVADVRPHLASARAAVVPLRIGSGTRLKALEAMAAGRPVVGTTIGLAGLGVAHDTHALVADQPQRFAEAASALLTNDSLAERIVAQARPMADQFAWSAIAPEFVRRLLAVGNADLPG